MALLADPVLAGRPPHGAGRRAGGQVGEASLPPGAGPLGPLGRVLDPVAVEPPLDRRLAGTFEALYARALNPSPVTICPRRVRRADRLLVGRIVDHGPHGGPYEPPMWGGLLARFEPRNSPPGSPFSLT